MENSTGVITINCDQGHFAGCFKGGKPEYTGFVSKWPGTQVQRSLNTLKNQFGKEPPQEGQGGCFSKTDGKKRRKSSSAWCLAVEPARCWSQREAKPQLLSSTQVLFFGVPAEPLGRAQVCHFDDELGLHIQSLYRGNTFDSESMKILHWYSLLRTNWTLGREIRSGLECWNRKKTKQKKELMFTYDLIAKAWEHWAPFWKSF